MKLRKQAHAVYKTQYHVVWVTKYRKEILNEGVSEYVKIKLKEVLKYYPDLEYIEIGMDKDHIHLHLVIPPKYSVSKMIEVLKSNTGRGMRGKFEFLKDVYWGTDGVWSKGYFVSTVGVDEAVIRRYVQMQGKEDAGQAELDLT